VTEIKKGALGSTGGVLIPSSFPELPDTGGEATAKVLEVWYNPSSPSGEEISMRIFPTSQKKGIKNGNTKEFKELRTNSLLPKLILGSF